MCKGAVSLSLPSPRAFFIFPFTARLHYFLGAWIKIRQLQLVQARKVLEPIHLCVSLFYTNLFPSQINIIPPPKHPDCPLKFDACEAPWLNGLGSLHSGRLPNLSITVLETKQDVMNNIWPFCFLRFAFGWMSIIELSGLKDFIYRHHRCMAKNVIFRIVYSTA